MMDEKVPMGGSLSGVQGVKDGGLKSEEPSLSVFDMNSESE
jgi:hypothetical protein